MTQFQLAAKRIECRVETEDGATGMFAVEAGREPNSIKQVTPLEWSSRVHGPIVRGSFSSFGESGWTGQMIALNSRQWHALVTTRQVERFLAAMLWGGQPLRIAQRAVALQNWQRESANMFRVD